MIGCEARTLTLGELSVLKIPPDLVDPDAGPVRVAILCSSCPSKVIGIVQERWTTSVPEEELDAWNLRGYFGKMLGLDESRAHVIGSEPLRRDADLAGETIIMCRRHGTMLANRRELISEASKRGTARVVRTRPVKRMLD